MISALFEQDIAVNTSTAKIPFTVRDAETPAADLAITVRSDVPDLMASYTLELIPGRDASERTLQITPAAGAVGIAHITVTVTDRNGESQSRMFPLYVFGTPVISAQPEDATVSEGDPVTFTVVASATIAPGLGLTYQWLRNGRVFGAPFTASFTIGRTQPLDAGEYVVIVTSVVSGLSVTSAPAHLTLVSSVPLTVEVAGSGSVYSTPSRISSPGSSLTQTARFPTDSVVVLTATPAIGWAFDGWAMDGGAISATTPTLSLPMNAPHRSVAVFHPLPDGASYTFIAITDERSPGPVTGGVDFDSVSSPQISDSGRVLFKGTLVGSDPLHPVPPQEAFGLWYSRVRISGHLDNAILRGGHSYFWVTPHPAHLDTMGLFPARYPNSGAGYEGLSFTGDGDIAVGAGIQPGGVGPGGLPPFRGGFGNASMVLVFAPYAPFTPPRDSEGGSFRIPIPEFQTVANDEEQAPGDDPNQLWLGVGSPVFQGEPRSAVPILGGDRVAFAGTYYNSSGSPPYTTNSGLFSGTHQNGVGLVLPFTQAGPGFRSMGNLLGSGRGALAGIGTYSGGSDAGKPVIWTDDGGIQASVGAPPPRPPAGLPPGARIDALLGLHLSKPGSITFSTLLTGTGVNQNNRGLIYLRHRGQFQVSVPVIRSGELITGAPAPANLFLVPEQDTVTLADTEEGELAVGTHLCCSGGASVIIRHDATGNHLAFIDGTPLPEFGPGMKLYRQMGMPAFWHPPTINAQGRIAFFGTVATSPPLGTGDRIGVWILERDGTLRQMLVTGQILPGFGRVDFIAEPRGNRWFNNRGEIALEIHQTLELTPVTREKTAILRIGAGSTDWAQIAAPASTPSGRLSFRWPADFPEATIERSTRLREAGADWTVLRPTVRRFGGELEAEVEFTDDLGFLRLRLPGEPSP